MTTASEYVEAIRTQQRAVRHATSLPLLVNGLAMVYLTYLESTMFAMLFPKILVPAVTYGVLLVVMLVQRRLIGVGVGNDRYGVLALALLALLFVPFGFVAVFLVGPVFFLGVGLGVLGWRAETAWLWGPGLLLMAVSPLVSLDTLDNHAAIPGWRCRCDGHLHRRAPGPGRGGARSRATSRAGGSRVSSTPEQHPLSQLEETVHQRARLGILAILVETRDADFTHLKHALQLTDGNLGRHLEVLVTSGYVELRQRQRRASISHLGPHHPARQAGPAARGRSSYAGCSPACRPSGLRLRGTKHHDRQGRGEGRKGGQSSDQCTLPSTTPCLRRPAWTTREEDAHDASRGERPAGQSCRRLVLRRGEHHDHSGRTRRLRQAVTLSVQQTQATWGIYQRMITAYRHPDRVQGRALMTAVIDSVTHGVPTALTELVTLGRTLKKYAADVLAFFDLPGTSNGPTEAINGRLEHLRGSALGFRNLTHYIARSLLEAGGFRPRLHPQIG